MLIDANIFQGFYLTEIGVNHQLCGCPRSLISTASPSRPIYHDIGKIIEHEWKSGIDPDWFYSWLSANLQNNTIQYLEPTINIGLEKNLKSLGFPKSRDIVYIRLGITATTIVGPCDFFTEDLDFYNPKEKGCPSKRRIKILKSSNGPVSKLLRKQDIQIKCTPEL